MTVPVEVVAGQTDYVDVDVSHYVTWDAIMCALRDAGELPEGFEPAGLSVGHGGVDVGYTLPTYEDDSRWREAIEALEQRKPRTDNMAELEDVRNKFAFVFCRIQSQVTRILRDPQFSNLGSDAQRACEVIEAIAREHLQPAMDVLSARVEEWQRGARDHG